MSDGWMYTNGRRERVFDEYLKSLSDNQLVNLIEYQIERLNDPVKEYDATTRLNKIYEEKSRRV